jgi:SnoaL-like polyketide cyclase
MVDLIDRALRLWSDPVPVGDEGVAAFRTVYTDPLRVNGVPTALVELVDRARMVQSALDPLRHEQFEQFEAPGQCAFAFRLYGRHVGALVTPLGDVAATGRMVEMRGMDIFELDDGLVAGVWAIADWLALLSQAGTVALAAGDSRTE